MGDQGVIMTRRKPARRAYGEGSLTYRESKRLWVARIELEPDDDGTRRQFISRDREAAQRFARRILDEHPLPQGPTEPDPGEAHLSQREISERVLEQLARAHRDMARGYMKHHAQPPFLTPPPPKWKN